MIAAALVLAACAPSKAPQPAPPPPAPVVDKPPDTPENQAQDTAWYMAREFVKRSLKAPATADFPVWGDDGVGSIYNENTKRWVVHGFVDSQNSYGANLRMKFIVRMEYVGGGDWKLVDIQTDE